MLDFWDDHKHRTVASVREFANALDIEELFVIGYEYWQQLRQRPIYKQLIECGVAVFFDNYRDVSLTRLLDEIGVTREMMANDAMRFLPGVVQSLDDKGLLEPAIREQLQDFYASDRVAAILARR